MVVLVLSFGVHSMAIERWMDDVMHYTMQDRRKGVKTSKQDPQSCNDPGYEGNLNLMPITSPARGGILLCKNNHILACVVKIILLRRAEQVLV
jgi:hypothetical protein